MAKPATKTPTQTSVADETTPDDISGVTDAVMAGILCAGKLARENNAHTPVVDGENGGLWVLMPGNIDGHANVTIQRRFEGRVVTKSISSIVVGDALDEQLRDVVNAIVKEWSNGKIG